VIIYRRMGRSSGCPATSGIVENGVRGRSASRSFLILCWVKLNNCQSSNHLTTSTPQRINQEEFSHFSTMESDAAIPCGRRRCHFFCQYLKRDMTIHEWIIVFFIVKYVVMRYTAARKITVFALVTINDLCSTMPSTYI
jgi:hypothetical protein